MIKTDFTKDILEFLSRRRETDKLDWNLDLLSKYNGFNSNDLLLLLVCLHNKYNIDLQQFIDKSDDFSINKMNNVLNSLINS